MELVLGRRRFDLRCSVVVVAPLEMRIEVDDAGAATSDPTSRNLSEGAIPHSSFAAAFADAERLIAAGVDVVELDARTTGHHDADDGPMSSDAMAFIVAAMTARLSVPIGVRTADAATAKAGLEAGATLLALPADAVYRCFADSAFVRAIEANGATVMVGESSSRSGVASTQPADELTAAAAHTRDIGLPVGRVIVDLTDSTTLGVTPADDLDAGEVPARTRCAARLAQVVKTVDRLVHDGQLVAVGGWDEGDTESAIALTSLLIGRGARVVRSRSPRLVQRVAGVVDAMAAARRDGTPPETTRQVATRPQATRPAVPRSRGS